MTWPTCSHKMPNRKKTRMGDQVNLVKRGRKEGGNTRGRENTYMHTYSGSGVLQSTQLTKCFVLETSQEGAGKGTPVTVRVSGGKKNNRKWNQEEPKENTLTYDEKRYG